MNEARPFVKWAGGKTQLLSNLIDLAPSEFNNYYEPFLGGGAFFFKLHSLEKIKKSIIPKSNIHIENINIKPDYSVEQSGVMLHGSAMIFSKDFIDNYEGLHPGPFMYGEEAILNYIVKRDNLITLYCPEIKILHKDDSSTNSVYKRALKKRRFYLKNFLRSLKVLQKLMKE